MAAGALNAAMGPSSMIPPLSFSAGGGGPSRSDGYVQASTGVGGINAAYDAGQWTVATGGSNASATQNKATGGAIPWNLVAVAGLIALAVWKHKH
ncbi:hypothetical protein [Comamonas sp.]|uniref:hypothetical protein n=1 Tax=Comamonas sp. TaxID=34028 RepID=UPI003A8E6582